MERQPPKSFMPIKLLFYHDCEDTQHFLNQIAFFFQHSREAFEKLNTLMIANDEFLPRDQYPCYQLPENPQKTQQIDNLPSSIVYRLGLLIHYYMTSRPYQYYQRIFKLKVKVERMIIPIKDQELNHLFQLMESMLSENPKDRPSLENLKNEIKIESNTDPKTIFNSLYYFQDHKNQLEEIYYNEGQAILEHFESL